MVSALSIWWRQMKQQGKLTLVGFLLCFAIIPVVIMVGEVIAQISITTTGGVSRTIDASDLVSGAGSDLISDYESAADAVSANISGTTGAEDQWRVDVRKVNTTWHGNLHLYIRRTSDGDAPSTRISGGGSYQEVTGTDQEFFNGEGDITGIEAQTKLSGVSIHIPPDTYSAVVYFTVVDI